MTGLKVVPPLDLSSDYGGDADHPLPDMQPDDLVDDDEDDQDEDTDQCRTRAA